MEHTKIDTIFEKVWIKTEDEIGEEEKELKKREMKRTFESDYDKAATAILELERKKQNLLKNKFKDFSLNSYRESVQEIKDHEAAKDDIANCYKDFFGEDIKR